MGAKEQRLRLLRTIGATRSRSQAVAPNSENSAQAAPLPHPRPEGREPIGRAPQGEGTESGSPQESDSPEETYPWEAEAEELLSEFRPQVAAYIAWAASPAKGRKPATQAELASLLGLKDDRTIRQWRAKDKRIDATIKERQAGPLWAHRRDIFEALVQSASTADAANFSDRKLALEMMGDYVPKQRQENVTPATPFTSDEYSQAAQQLALWESQQAEAEREESSRQ